MKTFVIILFCAVFMNAHELDWYNTGVFYQIYPKSFKDSDGNGVGDIKGIIEKLDHLKDLGVTGAWLSPIFKSPMKDGGYDIQDFETVDPLFGTNQDLMDLFAKAKDLGIKVILDFVPNHTSDKHDWFLLSANRTAGYEDYYVWRDCDLVNGNRVLPNNWIAVFHTPAWTYNAVRGQCYLHQFTPEQPDLNYRNQEVYNKMIAILKSWLVQGADGFRIDAINHMFEVEDLANEVYINPGGDVTQYDNLYHNHTMNLDESYKFIYDVRAMMDKHSFETDNVTRLMMTEAYASIPQQVAWYGYNETTPGSHMPFNFALISELTNSSTATDFKNAADSWLNAMPKWEVVANWVLGNHDRPRVGYRYGLDRHESLAIMTMMMPGINVVYYGEEILMTNNMDISFEESDDPQACQTNSSVYLEYTRDPVRTPFQWDETAFAGFSSTTGKTWLPVHENYKEVNLKKQKEAEKSTFKLYQKLIQLRKDKNSLLHGEYKSMAFGNNLFAFTRITENEKPIAVLINLGDTTKTNLTTLLGADYAAGFKGEILAVNHDSTMNIGDFVTNLQDVEVRKHEGLVLEISSGNKLAISLLLIVCSVAKLLF